MKPVYEVIRKGTTFTSLGPSPDKLLSRHKSYDAAKKAFDKAMGNVRLVEAWNGRRTVLDSALM
jgi:hypothetical protein